jgi:hypothetical protein
MDIKPQDPRRGQDTDFVDFWQSQNTDSQSQSFGTLAINVPDINAATPLPQEVVNAMPQAIPVPPGPVPVAPHFENARPPVYPPQPADGLQVGTFKSAQKSVLN